MGGALAEEDEPYVQELYKTMKPVQISEAFDAPQFCNDFINTAQRTVKCRAMSVMVYAVKTDGRGEPIRNKRTGKIIKHWKKYTE